MIGIQWLVGRNKNSRKRRRECEILRWADNAFLENMKSIMGRTESKVEGPGKVCPCAQILNSVASTQRFFPSSPCTVLVKCLSLLFINDTVLKPSFSPSLC